jgi:CheY-like chemotaxis protein
VKVLIAEDDPISRLMLQGMLTDWGYEVQAVEDGLQAWDVLQHPDAPRLAILDWVMPGLDGVEVCRRVRERLPTDPLYLLLLTSRDGKADIVTGLEAGANDYLSKPYDRSELRARIHVGCTVVTLQQSLAARVRELEEALAQVHQLQGLLPICSYCKKIRDDRDYWERVEDYIARRADVRFSHGICPQCWESEVRPQMERHRQQAAKERPTP